LTDHSIRLLTGRCTHPARNHAARRSTARSAPPVTDKGLARGRVGTLSGAVLGISCVAPGCTLTASIGLIAAAVGTRAPAIFLAGFVPMLPAASAYRELNRAEPDCGASFTWTTRAFGPHVGSMAGWGVVAASVIVLSNLAAVAVEFFYLFLARALALPQLAELPHDKPVNILTTLVILGLGTAVAYRGIEVAERVQVVLVDFQVLLLAGFCLCALAQERRPRTRPSTPAGSIPSAGSRQRRSPPGSADPSSPSGAGTRA
jgi:amino acid transporter